MITGVVSDDLPWVILNLPGHDGAAAVEFVVDTGFQGDLALPPHLIDRTAAQYSHRSARSMADGSRRQCDVYEMELFWNGEFRAVEVLILDGNPLLGTILMRSSHLSIALDERGEVVIELP